MFSDELVHHLVDMLSPLGPVRAKRMFGGHGIYLGDDMFALVSEDVLYFKVDEGNIEDYRRRALEAFIYRRRGRPIALSFRQAPEEALDDEDLLCAWAQRALEAARRAGKAARKRNAGEPETAPKRAQTTGATETDKPAGATTNPATGTDQGDDAATASARGHRNTRAVAAEKQAAGDKPVKKAATKKPPVKKPSAKKAATKKPPAKKAPKKAATKKAAAKQTATGKTGEQASGSASGKKTGARRGAAARTGDASKTRATRTGTSTRKTTTGTKSPASRTGGGRKAG